MVGIYRNTKGDYILAGDGDWGTPDHILREHEAFKKSWLAASEEKQKYAQQFLRRQGDGQIAFTPEHLQSIKEIFGVEEITPLPLKEPVCVIVPGQGTRYMVIEPNSITSYGGAPTDQHYRAAFKYIDKHFVGELSLPFYAEAGSDAGREHRLKCLAYGEVYGVKFTDNNNFHAELALTKAELAKIPELCAHIRRIHPDAPPARPGNDRVLQVEPAIA